eukprot:g13491.t1
MFASMLVTLRKLLEAAEALPVEVIDLSLAVPLSMELPLHVALEAPEWLQPESVAYMWFTSGSTGQPKGVLISHRAFSNWCKVKNPPQGISRESRKYATASTTGHGTPDGRAWHPVGQGYYNRPELTAQKFVERPGRNGKWYRTGDGGILRREPRCELEVVGRFDSQVKIRGMRVELGEIEIGVVKAAAGLLSNCAVKLRDSFLVAYCQVSAAASVMLHEPYCIMPVMSDFLLQRSSHELPRHMLPSKFILMQRLPLTANGKVDNKALPEVEVLGRKGIGPNDHFLALGGHSMSVLQVSRRLLKLAAAAGQDVSPASALGILLSPEKLIHSPRLRIYCQMLARGGVRFAAVGGSEEEQIGEEDVAELRINYVKHKVKSSDAELDHGAWEQAQPCESA